MNGICIYIHTIYSYFFSYSNPWKTCNSIDGTLIKKTLRVIDSKSQLCKREIKVGVFSFDALQNMQILSNNSKFLNFQHKFEDREQLQMGRKMFFSSGVFKKLLQFNMITFIALNTCRASRKKLCTVIKRHWNWNQAKNNFF